MEKKYDVVWGTDSHGRIELPFTEEMLDGCMCWAAGSDVKEDELNDVEKEFRRRLFALSDEVVEEFLKEWFFERGDDDWLAGLSQEEKLRWVVYLIEDILREEIIFKEWDEISQPFELSA